jgi:hypothetical protein
MPLGDKMAHVLLNLNGDELAQAARILEALQWFATNGLAVHGSLAICDEDTGHPEADAICFIEKDEVGHWRISANTDE